MENRQKAAWSGLLLVALMSFGLGAASAQPGPDATRRGAGHMMDMDHGMGGWGMMGGPGMLAGCGENMMWLGWNAIKLSKEQREKMNAIQRALREKQWVLMDRLHESMQSAGFYRDGKFDEQAARSAYATAEKMHRQMFDNLVEAQGRIDALLTPQQRQQLSQPGQ